MDIFTKAFQDTHCGGCGLELDHEEQKAEVCPRCHQHWPSPEYSVGHPEED